MTFPHPLLTPGSGTRARVGYFPTQNISGVKWDNTMLISLRFEHCLLVDECDVWSVKVKWCSCYSGSNY